MNRKAKKGAALLIAVIMMLVLTLVSSHLITLASVEGRTQQIRRYTSNLAFQSEAGIGQMVEQMNKVLLGYGPTFLEPMKGMMDQLTPEAQQVVACAYGFRWLTREYFGIRNGGIDLSLDGQKRLLYEVETEQAVPGMKTQLYIGNYVKGMRTSSAGWLGTLPVAQVRDLSDYAEVSSALGQLEQATARRDAVATAQSVARLAKEMNKLQFVIESIAQTKERLEIFATQQRIGRVGLEVTENMGDLIYTGGYQWRDAPPEALAQEVLCLGELTEEAQLVVEGTLKVSPAAQGLAPWVDEAVVKRYAEDMSHSPEGIYYLASGEPIDLAQLQEAGDAALLILAPGMEQKLYTSAPSQPWRGIVLAYGPVVLEGPMQLEGALLCQETLRIEGGTVRISQNREIFFELGDASLQDQLLSEGLWCGVGLPDRMLRTDGTFIIKGAVVRAVLDEMYDGHMVDRKGPEAWE